MDTQAQLTRSGQRLPEQTRERATVTPPVDIYENNEEVLLVADVPGVISDGVSINLDKDQLTLWARRNGAASAGARPAEHAVADYYRAFLVPHGIDSARITAEISEGVLRVHLPKSEALKPRRIEVKAG